MVSPLRGSLGIKHIHIYFHAYPFKQKDNIHKQNLKKNFQSPATLEHPVNQEVTSGINIPS